MKMRKCENAEWENGFAQHQSHLSEVLPTHLLPTLVLSIKLCKACRIRGFTLDAIPAQFFTEKHLQASFRPKNMQNFRPLRGASQPRRFHHSAPSLPTRFLHSSSNLPPKNFPLRGAAQPRPNFHSPPLLHLTLTPSQPFSPALNSSQPTLLSVAFPFNFTSPPLHTGHALESGKSEAQPGQLLSFSCGFSAFSQPYPKPSSSILIFFSLLPSLLPTCPELLIPPSIFLSSSQPTYLLTLYSESSEIRRFSVLRETIPLNPSPYPGEFS